jgi:hypothetical protein
VRAARGDSTRGVFFARPALDALVKRLSQTGLMLASVLNKDRLKQTWPLLLPAPAVGKYTGTNFPRASQ